MTLSRKALLGALFVTATLLAACSSSDESAEIDDSTPQASATSEPTPTTAATTAEGDSILTEAMVGGITLGDESVSPFVAFDLDTESEPPTVLGAFAEGDGIVEIPVDLAAQAPIGEMAVQTPDGSVWFASDLEFTDDSGNFSAVGKLTSDSTGETMSFVLDFPLGAGTTTFELDENRAIVRGDLGSNTYDQVSYLIDAHPEVDTLVLAEVPGSVNDAVNMETGRLVREAGYTTIVPSNGMAASGGVDLFTAGVTRIVEPGGQLGIHSWCCGPNGETAAELDRDDSAHADQLAYFTEMLGAELGPEFYFATLEAAPFDDVHFMTAEEIARYQLTTDQ